MISENSESEFEKMSLKESLRILWQPPGKLSERDKDRSVTFLELFYDLVYVVLISEIAHTLSKQIDPAHIGGFVFLFVVVWWAWFNGSTYHELHGTNDVRTRVFTFLQMFTVLAMAVFAHNAMGEGSIGFALSYAAFQLVLNFLWWRTGVYDPDHRPLSRPYTCVFLISSLLFIASIWVAIPWRFGMWVVAIVTVLVLPLFVMNMGRKHPHVQAQIDLVMEGSPALVERFGLFTIIVLGEVIVGVVQGIAGHHELNWTIGITAALGMLIAIGLWWVYFDVVSHRLPKRGTLYTSSWMYLHLPLTMGIAAAGAAILNMVEHTGSDLPGEIRWLLVSSVFIVFLSISFLIHTIIIEETRSVIFQNAKKIILVSAVLVLMLGLFQLDTLLLLIALCLLMLAPVYYGLKAWARIRLQEKNASQGNTGFEEEQV